MSSTIAEVDKLFAAGAESVTLTRAEGVGAALHVHNCYRAARARLWRHPRRGADDPPGGTWDASLHGGSREAADVLRGKGPRLIYYPVSKAVESPKNDSPELVEPL